MSKTILVPTDFSENAWSATLYACHLAKKRNYSIHLLHCYTTNSITGETNEDDPVPKADILMQELIASSIAKFPTLSFTSACIRGLIDEKLPLEAKDDKYILIVMGTTGSSAKKSIYWGSTTVAITAKSPISVIAIPVHYEYQELKHINLLTKFKAEELETLREYVRIIGPVEKVSLTHVYREAADKEEILTKLTSWEFTINEMNITQQTEILSAHIVKTDINLDTVPEVVNRLIEDSHSDIVLITKTRKSFFGRLFTPSISKKLTLNLKKPAFFDKIEEP